MANAPPRANSATTKRTHRPRLLAGLTDVLPDTYVSEAPACQLEADGNKATRRPLRPLSAAAPALCDRDGWGTWLSCVF